MDYGNIDKADNSQNRRESSALLPFRNVGPDHQISNIYHPQNQGSGQAGIPGPPYAPDRTRPNRAGNQNQGAENNAHFSAGMRPAIVNRPSPDEIADRENKHPKEGKKGEPGRGHMDVENPLRLALPRGGGDEEIRVHREDQKGRTRKGEHAIGALLMAPDEPGKGGEGGQEYQEIRTQKTFLPRARALGGRITRNKFNISGEISHIIN